MTQLTKLFAKNLSNKEEEMKGDNDHVNLPAVDKVKKTALNTLVRFDIDSMGYDNSSLNMYEEMKKKGVGQDEEEFTDIVFSGEGGEQKTQVQRY